MWGGIDRRRFPRINYQCLISIGRSDLERHFLTHTENIGIGGICVILAEDLGIFSEVTIELMLKDGGEPVKSKGTVVWVVKRGGSAVNKTGLSYDTGIEFVTIKTKDKKRIERIIDNILNRAEKKK